MRLTLYYILHTVKNQIRKLCRTWVAVFLLVCLAIGVIFGLGAAALSSLFEEETPDSGYEETLPEEDEELPPEEELDPETAAALIELIAGGVVLIVLVTSVLGAQKSASSIFLMADVNLLFPAPLRPQSVLLFRLIMQAGTSLAATLYLLFQLPNLILNLGLSPGAAAALLLAWLLLLVYSKLISVLCYTLTAGRPRLQSALRYGTYTLLVLLAGAYYLYSQGWSGDHLGAATAFFNAPATRLIPLWGWLKALVVYAFAGNAVGTLTAALALILAVPLLFFVIRRTKADFYEEAMARSEEIAATLAAQREKNGLNKRKKDRSDRLERDGFHRGTGATVYFHKALYNRFRFAHFHVFTKTSETYLVIALGIAALQLLVLKSHFFPAVALAMAGFTFFRALGNPIATDIEMESFFLIPDSAHRKVLFSFLGGTLNTLLDVLPAFLLSALLLRAHPGEAVLWLLLILSMGSWCDSVGLFIDLSLSTGISQMIRSVVQVMFVYFGSAPAAVLVIVGLGLGKVALFAAIATALNLGATALLLALAPLFILRGRK